MNLENKTITALENITKAVEITDSDTLGMTLPDSYIIWTASGSWTGSSNVTLGDLRTIVEYYKNEH